MNIKSKLRTALLAEGENKRKKFGCVMTYLNTDEKNWGKVQEVIEDKDLYLPKGEEEFYGRELKPHVTILFGLHSDIPDTDIEEEINKIKSPTIKLGKVSSFTNKDFDVLKYDIESEDLHELNKKFTKFPHTTDYPNYHPHCTIAYVNKGMAEQYIKKLNELDEIEITPSKIVYSKADGEKKDYKLDK